MLEFYKIFFSKELSMEDTKDLSRRSFFKIALAGAAVVPFIVKASKSFASDGCPKTAPVGKSIVSPTEGMGKTLQYVTEASTSKHPKYKTGNACRDCKFFNVGKAEGGYAPCTMMGMKYVSNCGWCSSFNAKA